MAQPKPRGQRLAAVRASAHAPLPGIEIIQENGVRYRCCVCPTGSSSMPRSIAHQHSQSAGHKTWLRRAARQAGVPSGTEQQTPPSPLSPPVLELGPSDFDDGLFDADGVGQPALPTPFQPGEMIRQAALWATQLRQDEEARVDGAPMGAGAGGAIDQELASELVNLVGPPQESEFAPFPDKV
ncbi:hypothetical protein OC842_007270, partial [Tilletia horrida]